MTDDTYDEFFDAVVDAVVTFYWKNGRTNFSRASDDAIYAAEASWSKRTTLADWRRHAVTLAEVTGWEADAPTIAA